MPSTVPYRVGDEPVPGFRLLAFLGRGGFGEVWKASAPGGTEIALKLIRLDDATGLKEFRSLRLVKRLRHPNLVPIVAYWLKDQDGALLSDEAVAVLGGDPSVVETARWTDSPGSVTPNGAQPAEPVAQPAITPAELIIAMGLGEANLSQRLRQCQASGVYGLPDEELLAYFADAARAIDYLNRPVHEMGAGPVAIQHCDIKPHNMLVVGGALQLCDFGLASMLGDVRTTSAAAGTIAYAAPECFVEGKPSATTDQYSLAVSYYELRTGALPYDAVSVAQISQAAIKGQLNFLRVSLAEQEVLKRATNPDPAKRFPTATAMVQALSQAVASAAQTSDQTTIIRPVERRKLPRSRLLAGLAVCTLVAILGVRQYQDRWANESQVRGEPSGASNLAAQTSVAGGKLNLPLETLQLTPGEEKPDDAEAADQSTSSVAENTTVPETAPTNNPAEQSPPSAQPAETFTNSLGMKLVLIPSGEFAMGTDEGAPALAEALGSLPDGFDNADEHPLHRVHIDQPFYLGEREVTVGEFQKFVTATEYQTEAERDERGGWGYDSVAKAPLIGQKFTWRDWGASQTENSPVANVSWNDAQAFCEWLSRQEQKKYRLPTEAEWEYACRAGTTTRFSSGDTAKDLLRVANVLDQSTHEQLPRLSSDTQMNDGWAFTAPVGSFPANSFGLHDMHGNVAEWCADGYVKDAYLGAPAQILEGVAEAEYRVLRGGSWIHPAVRCRSAYRGFDAPSYRSGYVGFRVVCEP